MTATLTKRPKAKPARKKAGKKYTGPSSEEILLADIVALMESSDLPPWQRPWQGHQGEHRNLATGKAYRGANPMLLELGALMRGHTMPLWIGGSQAKALGWFPKKGTKAVRITRPQLNRYTDEAENLQTGQSEEITRQWVSYKPVAVFNASDLQGGDEASSEALRVAIAEALGQQPETAPAAMDERLAKAWQQLEAWKVTTSWGGTRACYSPDLDRISMPAVEAFTSRETCAATWAHEQAHSTGHHTRLSRKFGAGAQFGGQAYAREELVAELASVLICYRLQIGYQLEQHAAYLKSWARGLKESGPKELFKVLSDARKAADLIAPEPAAEDGDQ